MRQYGELPEFVVLGGLVPDLLCSGAPVRHAGTTDVDVQADLAIAHGAINAARLERALQAEADSLKVARTKATLGVLLEKWLPQHELDATTWMNYASQMRKYIPPAPITCWE